MRYDASTVQICREDGWQEVGSAIQANGNFVPVTGAALNSTHTSNALSFTGFFGQRTASVEGGGGAVLVVNNIVQGATAQIQPGDIVAIRAPAASSSATVRTYTLSISSVRRAWTITTRDPTPANLNLSVVTGSASAMDVAYTTSTSYGSAVRFSVTNSGEAPTDALSASNLSNLTNFEFYAAGLGDGCSGMALAGGANCLIEVRPKATGSGAIAATLTVSNGMLNDDISLSGAATGWPCPVPLSLGQGNRIWRFLG